MITDLIYKHAREKFVFGKVCVDIIVIIDDVLVVIVILILFSCCYASLLMKLVIIIIANCHKRKIENDENKN